MDKEHLLKEIEEMRKRLQNAYMENKGEVTPHILKLSQKLDHLLNDYSKNN